MIGERSHSRLGCTLVRTFCSSVTDHFKTNHQRSNQNQPVISLSL